MGRYIWEHWAWPQITWRSDALLVPLGQARHAQGELASLARDLDLSAVAEILLDEAVGTAAIEGEAHSRDSLRLSVERRLGIAVDAAQVADDRVRGFVDMLADATHNHDAPMSAERLFAWHAAMFPRGRSGGRKIKVGGWRRGSAPMQVVSGPAGRETIHFEAPPAADIEAQMQPFFAWWHKSRGNVEGLVRAGIAHLWFVTAHPFEDGNGRITRALTDTALAQDGARRHRLFSMSTQILAERSQYYAVLEHTQKGGVDVTDWLVWFLGCLERAMRKSYVRVHRGQEAARLWETLFEMGLNPRQQIVLRRILDAIPIELEGGLTTRAYIALTDSSRQTAKRDIQDLVTRGILKKNSGGGRSVSYDLVWEILTERGE